MINYIENDKLIVGVKEFGCEITSIKSKTTGYEFMWQGNPDIWSGQAPILFPIVGRLIDDNTEIKEGDIISFYDYFKGKQIVITHRVVEILDPNTDPGYITQGDNEKMSDDIVKSRDDIQSVYKFRIPFLGKFIDFLKTPFGFIVTLVIPLLSFICWQAYKLIILFFKSKQAELDEQAEQIKNTQSAKSEISEEEKNAIIAEYLAKQKAQEKENDDAKNKNNKN